MTSEIIFIKKKMSIPLEVGVDTRALRLYVKVIGP